MQILVLNKADAVAASPLASKAARETPWASLHPAITPQHIVATSARDGRGLDKLLAAIETALLATMSKASPQASHHDAHPSPAPSPSPTTPHPHPHPCPHP